MSLFGHSCRASRHQPEDSVNEVSQLKDAELAVIDSVWGHAGMSDRFRCVALRSMLALEVETSLQRAEGPILRMWRLCPRRSRSS